MSDHAIGYITTGGTRQSVTPTTPLPTTSGSGASSTTVQGAAADNAAAVGSPVLVGAVNESTFSTYTAGDVGNLHIDTRGNLRVAIIGVDGTSGVGTQSTLVDGITGSNNTLRVSSNGAIFNGSTWDRHKKPNAVARLLSAAADTNATSAKASAGDVFTITGHNANAAGRYLKLYNKASAPTVGTDTPVATLYLPATATFSFQFEGGLYFATGIAYALTTGVADADTGALTAADILGLNITYA